MSERVKGIGAKVLDPYLDWPNTDARIMTMRAIEAERVWQDANREEPFAPDAYLARIVEELGEASKAAREMDDIDFLADIWERCDRRRAYIGELVQVAALAVRAIEAECKGADIEREEYSNRVISGQ